jgi:hypothetical protein
MENKNLVLVNGKLQLLSLFSEIGKLQKADVKKTIELCSSIISESAKKALESKRGQDEDLVMDTLAVKQEAVSFLKGIGLDSEDEDA